MRKKILLLALVLTLPVSASGGVVSMSNKYCNLQGTQKISESYNNINAGFDQVENDIEENKTKIHNHINGVSDRHDAEVITYSGIVPGATNVKQAIDNTRNRVEEIITTPSESVSAQEIIDARGGYISLGGRLDEFESQMADTAKIRINAIDPPSPLTAAVGDGIADDTAALQAMLTYLDDLGGGTLILPPKHTFKTTYSLFYGSNISIIGYGATISFNPSHADATCFVPLTYTSEDSFTTNVYFAGFKLVSDASKGNGIGTPKVKYMTIRDVWTDQLHWHLVDIAAGKNITVDNCHAENLTTAAFQADNLSTSGGMYAELSDGSLVSAIIDNDVCDNVKIINCTVKNGTGTGFHMHREGGKNILVQGCTFEALTTGIISDVNTNWYNVILKDNQIIDCEQGIVLQAAHHDLIIESNVVDITGTYGIAVLQNNTAAVRDVGTKNHIIKSNVVKNAKKGIALDWSLNAIVQGNVLESCADDGSMTVDYESSKDPPLYGMSIYKCNNTLILDNIFKDCSLGGLKVNIKATNTCDKLIIKNNSFKNTGNAIVFVGYDFSTTEYTTPHGSNIIISNNLIELGTYGFLGVIVGGIKGLIVCDNIIKTNNNVGLTIDYCSDIYVKNNKVSISNLAGSGVRFGISLYGSKGYIENNEVSGWESLSTNIGIRTSDSNIEGLTFELPKVDVGATALIHYKANAKPTTSALAVGSTCKNTSPSAGDYYGWVYVNGAWKGYGLIES